jgi:SAM-dependent methyltransferase
MSRSAVQRIERISGVEARVAAHYGQPGLEKRILEALVATGLDLDRLSAEDLAPVDEIHTGGRDATIAFADEVGFAPGSHLLDVGCGLGGAARYFAKERGCRVTGIDLTDDYVRTAATLARLVGLEDRVTYRQASALDIPFAEQSFDGAYMLHVGMNIEDKAALFAEIRRVLKPGATFGIYDVVLTGKGEPSYPLPCALTPETAFLATVDDYRQALEGAGFEIEKVRDRLEVARAFFRTETADAGRRDGGPPPLGIHILLKGEAPRILPLVARQFEEGILSPTEFVSRAV